VEYHSLVEKYDRNSMPVRVGLFPFSIYRSIEGICVCCDMVIVHNKRAFEK
jgi:hypothetical protein